MGMKLWAAVFMVTVVWVVVAMLVNESVGRSGERPLRRPRTRASGGEFWSWAERESGARLDNTSLPPTHPLARAGDARVGTDARR